MAILGKDAFGRINPAFGKPLNPKESEEIVEEEPEVEIPIEPIEEPERIQNPGASLEYLDRMRRMRTGEKTPIGNQILSDAKAYEPKD